MIHPLYVLQGIATDMRGTMQFGGYEYTSRKQQYLNTYGMPKQTSLSLHVLKHFQAPPTQIKGLQKKKERAIRLHGGEHKFKAVHLLNFLCKHD